MATVIFFAPGALAFGFAAVSGLGRMKNCSSWQN